MIAVSHLTKNFGTITAVDDISFTVEKGQILGFLGPNAAGKTTTMRVLCGYFPPTRGQVQVAGLDVLEDELAAKEKVGYLPENPPLYPEMNVNQYLNFVAKLKGLSGKSLRQRSETVIEQTQIKDVLSQRIGTLSKGFRQRVGLAQALIHNPAILILDEPTAGLDPNQISSVRKLIKSLAPDHTIIISTHILPEVSVTCTQVIIIDRGKIVATDTPDRLATGSSFAEQIYLETDAPMEQLAFLIGRFDGLNLAPGEITSPGYPIYSYYIRGNSSPQIRQEIAGWLIRESWKIFEIRPERTTLETVFHKLTRHEENQ